MAELTRAQFDGHRQNLSRLIDGGASDEDVNFYLKDNKVTVAQLRVPPDFVGIPKPIIPTDATALKLDPTSFRVGGALTGGALGTPLGPAGMLGGAALLGEGAGQAAELFNKFALGQRDERSPGQRGIDAGINIATDVGMSGIGGAAIPAVKGALGSIINPVRNRLSGQGAAANLKDFAAAGVPPSAGAVTGNRAVQGTEQALSRLPSSARTMQVQAAGQQAALSDELERIATGVGSARTSFTAGRRVVEGVESFAGNVRVKGKELFNAIPIRKDTPVAMDDTRAFINEDLQAFANSPELQGMVVSPKLQGILSAIERNGGRLNWEQTKRLRTAIGDQISDPRLISDSGTAELKRLYGALTGDMERAAATQGEKALTGWRRATYNAEQFRLTAQGRNDGTRSGGISGAFACLDGAGCGFSQPLPDAFIMARMDGKRVPVSISGKQVPMISATSGYYPVLLAVDSKHLPLNASTTTPTVEATPWARGGALAALHVKRLYAITGVLQGVQLAPVTIGGHAGVVGAGGVLYVEDVRPGTYAGSAGKCSFTVTVPVSAMPVVDVGTVRCE